MNAVVMSRMVSSLKSEPNPDRQIFPLARAALTGKKHKFRQRRANAVQRLAQGGDIRLVSGNRILRLIEISLHHSEIGVQLLRRIEARGVARKGDERPDAVVNFIRGQDVRMLDHFCGGPVLRPRFEHLTVEFCKNQIGIQERALFLPDVIKLESEGGVADQRDRNENEHPRGQGNLQHQPAYRCGHEKEVLSSKGRISRLRDTHTKKRSDIG